MLHLHKIYDNRSAPCCLWVTEHRAPAQHNNQIDIIILYKYKTLGLKVNIWRIGSSHQTLCMVCPLCVVQASDNECGAISLAISCTYARGVKVHLHEIRASCIYELIAHFSRICDIYMICLRDQYQRGRTAYPIYYKVYIVRIDRVQRQRHFIAHMRGKQHI